MATEANWGKMRTESSSRICGHWRKCSSLIYFTYLIVVCPAHSFLWPLSLEQRSWWNGLLAGLVNAWGYYIMEQKLFPRVNVRLDLAWEIPGLSVFWEQRKVQTPGCISPTPTPTSMPNFWALEFELTSPNKSARGNPRGCYQKGQSSSAWSVQGGLGKCEAHNPSCRSRQPRKQPNQWISLSLLIYCFLYHYH